MTEPPHHAVPKKMGMLIVATLFVLLINAAAFFFVLYRAAQQPVVTVTDATTPYLTQLCPGETLDYQFTINVNKAATVDVSTSYHYEGNLRPSFVRLQQFIFKGPTSFTLVRHAVIPPFYADPESGTDIEWTPGKYGQRTVVNIEGRSTGAEILDVPFSIRSSCP